MDIIEKIGDTITEKGKVAADKAKELAAIANLKSQISTCEEVMKKNYLEIGKILQAVRYVFYGRVYSIICSLVHITLLCLHYK